MQTDPLVLNFQASILALAEKQLRRRLTKEEKSFVTAREGLLALEAIHDTVTSLSGVELEQYLRQEVESDDA